MRENPGVPLPPEINDYLCDLLDGKIRTPSGRPRDDDNPVRLLRKTLILATYERYHKWLKRRKRLLGLKGWTLIQNADWWQGPPSERAARMTSRRWARQIDWRRIQNIVSEVRTGG